MDQEFDYYLHGSSSSFETREILETQGVELSEEAWENMGRPFYEVGLKCSVDEYGKVTIKGLK